MLKLYLKIMMGIVAFLILLYIAPNFIDISRHNDTIETEIERITGFDFRVKGKISFVLLPLPSLVMNNIDVNANIPQNDDKPAQSATFLNAKRLFVSLDLKELLRGKIKINRIVVDSGYLNYDKLNINSIDNINNFLKGKIFNDISFSNSTILFTSKDSKQIRFSDINMNFTSIEGQGIKGRGNLNYLANKINNINVSLMYVDTSNYNLSTAFIITNKQSNINSKLNLVEKEGEKSLTGNIGIKTSNLYIFIRDLGLPNVLPDTGFYNDKFEISTSLQTTNETLFLKNGIINSGNVFANWTATIPMIMDNTQKYIIDKSNSNLKLNIKNIQLSNILKSKREPMLNIIPIINENKYIINLLSQIKTDISIQNIMLKNGQATDFNINTTPVIDNGKTTAINIDNYNYSVGTGKMKLTGSLTNLDKNIILQAKVNATIPNTFSNILFGNTTINSFDGNIYMIENDFKLTNATAYLGKDKIIGDLSKISKNGIDDYELNIKSEYFNGATLTPKIIDLSFIIEGLSKLKTSKFKIQALIKKLKLGNEMLNDFKLENTYDNGTLAIKKLQFKTDKYSSFIKGDLINLAGKDGKFKNFDYIITSDNLKGITLPFIKNSFIEKIIAGGVKNINIKLNGDASSPTSDISAKLNNIDIHVNGKLLDSNADYKIKLSHSELKGFLFAWGYIDESVMNYLYDNIPFTLTADVEKSNVKNIVLTTKNNVFKGNIITENKKTNINLSIDTFDFRTIFKRLKDTDAYIDLTLKLFRTFIYDFNLKATRIVDYDSNVYNDVDIKLYNANNPGIFNVALKKDTLDLKIKSEIINNRIVEGTLDVSGYKLPSDLMQNEALNLKSGMLKTSLKFKTNGLNAYQIISNLNGDFNVKITDGTITGISGYDTILSNIVTLANITTNNVLYAIENSFKGGMLNFTSFDVNGKVNGANIKSATFELISKNIIASGFLNANLIRKSLELESVFDIKNLSLDTITLLYNATGFVNNIQVEMDSSNIMTKLNTSFLLKKKKELLGN